MAVKLFGTNPPKTDLRRNVFDLSASNTFTLSAGILLPTLVRELNVGEKVQLDISALTRTQPLNTAAFVRNTQYFHAFFVPYKQLWQQWDNFYTGMDYRQSTLQRGYSRMVPQLDLAQVILDLIKGGYFADIVAQYSYPPGTTDHNKPPQVTADKSKLYDRLGFPRVYAASRLLDMLGYGFDIAVPQQFIVSGRPYSFNFADKKNRFGIRIWPEPDGAAVNALYLGEVSKSVAEEADRKAGKSGVNDVNKQTKDLRARISSLSDLFEFILAPANASVFFPAQSKGSVSQAVIDFVSYCFDSVKVNPFRLLAYQKIYYDFYRRQDYEANNVYAYNMDDQGGDVFTGDGSRWVSIFELHYRWLAKDYFTGVVPSELYGVSAAASPLLTAVATPYRTSEGYLNGTNSGGNNLRWDGVGNSTDNAVNLNGTVSTRSIRAAFAIEKLLKLTRRAGRQDYISQMAARFGVDVPQGRGDLVKFLGGATTHVDITEVLTTANTDHGETGQIYGRGIGTANGGTINFEAKEHGLIMVITSIMPDSDYAATGMSAFNCKAMRGDYFQPEFQDLGYQPLFSHELSFNPAAKNGDFVASRLLGYVPRYSEYKTSYDELHGEFRVGRSLSAWCSPMKLADSDFFSKNGYASSTSQDAAGILPSRLLVSPTQLDTIFSIQYDGREVTDQFMCVQQAQCKIIRPMSVTGQNL